jgi:hypothetical protein
MQLTSEDMRLVFRRVETLPRLAWSARLRAADPEVLVVHGPWVESADDRFFEGAWNGRIGDDPDAATLLVGSAARLEAGGVVFATACNSLDRLFSLRTERELFISNSVAYLLVAAGDGPDPKHLHYFDDFLEQYRLGTRRIERPIHTRGGRHLLVHMCCNLHVEPDLSWTVREKRLPPVPVSYTDYVSALEAAISSIAENASSPERRVGYRSLVSVSRGYDSPAIAVLARAAGCREAISVGSADGDGGSAIAERLGYQVHEIDPLAFLDREGMPEVEFGFWPGGSNVVLAGMEEELRGTLRLSGRMGDRVWTTQEAKLLDHLVSPNPSIMFGAWVTEFRLRVGFLNFAPAFYGAQHSRALLRITVSDEMAPWRLGTDYDRPVPRRITEEAGIPRDWFGQKKAATLHRPVHSLEALSDASRRDLLAFWLAHRPGPLGDLWHRGLRRLQTWDAQLRSPSSRIGPLWRRVPAIPAHYARGLGPLSVGFQWSFSHLAPRYADALSQYDS